MLHPQAVEESLTGRAPGENESQLRALVPMPDHVLFLADIHLDIAALRRASGDEAGALDDLGYVRVLLREHQIRRIDLETVMRVEVQYQELYTLVNGRPPAPETDAETGCDEFTDDDLEDRWDET